MALYAIVAPLVEGASCSIVLHEAALQTYPGLAPAETGTGWEAGRDRDPEQNLEALRDPSRYRQNLA